MPKISFSNNVIPINQIDAQQKKKIQKLYEDAIKDVQGQIDNLKSMGKSNASTKLQIYRLNQLKDDIQYNLKEATGQIEKEIKDNMKLVSQMTIEKYAEYLGNQQISLKVSYAHISNDIINNITSGNLYKDQYGADWNFSKRIWGDYNSAKGELASIVTNGMLSGKGCYDIAKDLEKYVMPNAQKPWDWSKVYPGCRKKIDYNAQRLARTMISHAYQQSLVEMSKNNPFASGIEWRSALIEHRTCELCEQRHGQIFPVNQLPLDHPNGLCTYLMVFNKSKKEIADDLVNWVNGEDNPELDKYATYLTGEDFSKMSKMQKISKVNISEKAKEEITNIHPIVNGQDISQTWERRPNEFDFAIDDIVNAQGFDGLPRVVSKEEFDKLVKESNFISVRGYSAPNEETLIAYHNQLINGKWYIDCSSGGSVHGQGMYVAGNYGTELGKRAIETSKTYSQGIGKVETITMAKDSKIITEDEIVEKRKALRYVYAKNKLNKELTEEQDLLLRVMASPTTITPEESEKAFSIDFSVQSEVHQMWKNISNDVINEVESLPKDNGQLAALWGYDAIEVNVSTEGDKYFVILNRTKMIVME